MNLLTPGTRVPGLGLDRAAPGRRPSAVAGDRAGGLPAALPLVRRVSPSAAAKGCVPGRVERADVWRTLREPSHPEPPKTAGHGDSSAHTHLLVQSPRWALKWANPHRWETDAR